MFDLDDCETPHASYAQMQPFVFINSSTLQPWNKTSIGYHKKAKAHRQIPTQIKGIKTHHDFYKRVFSNTPNKEDSILQRKRKLMQEKEKFPVSTLTFEPDNIEQQSFRKNKKKQITNTTFRFKRKYKSTEKVRENKSEDVIPENQSKDGFKALRPSFDYTALLKRREQNKIKYKALTVNKQVLGIQSKINSIKNLAQQRKQSRIYSDSQKYPQKSSSFVQIRTDFDSIPSIENIKAPKKPFFVGIRKIMTQKV